ncbi:MAG: DUF4845 domain-containing protein [Thiobacillus sp.]|jgi:hypothetical protein|uniref:DUF4845 domain-containing protein n=1 Tax=Thiobacillus sp. TaxID=924 RepID=UPI002896017E|nr:DUF4845 domain-containing protein [Thiobacillus sp.]MDT3705336.1 DUF4845 domain-containing protein [Thiobacillus sp.]
MHCAHPVKSRQRGLSMIGFLFVAVMLVIIAMLAMKVVPAYIEFFGVKKVLADMAHQSDLRNMSNGEIRNDFDKRASVGYVKGVTGKDLVVDRRGGVPVVSADYTFRTRLVHNISLVIDFSASSDPSSAPPQID